MNIQEEKFVDLGPTVYEKYLTLPECRRVVKIADDPCCVWVRGRQGGGYEKCDATTIWDERLLALIAKCREIFGVGMPFDAWLIRYTNQTYSPTHVDPVEGKKHHRVNVLLNRVPSGGTLVMRDRAIEMGVGDAIYFRPDIIPHAVTRVMSGRRLVLSVGGVEE